MTPTAGVRPPRPSERSIVEVAAAYLQAQGYRTYRDVDGTDYFDLVAQRATRSG